MSFVISSSSSEFTHRGASKAAGDAGNVKLYSGDIKKEFAQLGQIKARGRTCPFCDLIYRAVQRYSGIRVGAETALFLSWEVDGRQIGKGGRTVNRTRRIRLSWRETSGKEESVYLVLVAPKGARGINSDAYAASAKESHFLGRGMVDNREKQALMKSWIDLCVEKHGPKCEDTHSTRRDFKRLIGSTYFGVIDVIDMQLRALPVVNGEPERYVALSYVWGKNPLNDKPYMTTRANVMVRIQHGGLESVWQRLPRTIQETILLVARLGERYVWIDALCIVQDSTTSWELNAKAMHLAYGNAHFTICAADGDAEAGLRAVSPTLRVVSPETHRKRASAGFSPPPVKVSHAMRQGQQQQQQQQRPPSPSPDSTRSSSPSRHGMTTEEVRGTLRAADAAEQAPLTAKCLPNVRLLVSRPPEAVIEDSIWNKRGWTFQERLLSRRCLIFAEGQVYFQCRSTVMSQHIFTDGGINGWSLDWTNSPLRTLGELQRRAFWFYMKCVPLYTSRNLTKARDILTAFQGTSWLLQQRLGAPLFYGLPTSHFDLALLWMPSRQLERRGRDRTSPRHRTAAVPCTQDEMGNCSCDANKSGSDGEDFPSWSWSGWIGGNADYPQSMIDGCVANPQEWLKHHTWIQWYIRDYEGNLRPLWDKRVLREDQSTETRWRGYAGKQPSEDAQHASHSTPRQSGPTGSRADRAYTPEREAVYRSYASKNPRPRRSPPSHPPRHIRQRSDSRKGKSWSRQANTAYVSKVPAGYYNGDANDDELDEEGPLYSRTRSDGDSKSYRQVSSIEPRRGNRKARVSWEDNSDYEDHELDVDDDDKGWSSQYGEEWVGETSSDGDDVDDDDDDDAGSAHSDSADEGGFFRITTKRRTDRRSDEDNFGRPVRASEKGLNATNFTSIIPDTPFSIIRGPFPKTNKDHQIRAMPILQFWTWRTELLVASRPPSPRHNSALQSPVPGTPDDAPGKLSRHDIVDKAGDWCGSIMLPPRRRSSHHNGTENEASSRIDKGGSRGVAPVMFIALSDAKSLTEDECPVWNYYIAKEREESEWDLYYVMMLERNRERALWERVAVGKVFQAAFRDAIWDEIKLG
ncbi:heterokaryon incompatibility protein-domain-containing protein [Microdochium trichocladiopsis]|uniref:Heterokaryon incompatibility protein-domain-containing protein n=1 Tax=Microdochium trichocladiopsis TaxID=1682393 RepID=A0A9P8Y5P1_9PEZI|nr:heterokaryon incompatibility protein-domain-containing protein [Microdochium trichocladiopsis]KAH7029839.1 heterokaryon incompatibility protein-domain-containing protein [Microdochium trichocladiopsis]